MELEELARRLVEMYDGAERDKYAMLHLFGVRYVHEIGGEHTPKAIVQYAINHLVSNIPLSEAAEIQKGVTLSKYVVDRGTLEN